MLIDVRIEGGEDLGRLGDQVGKVRDLIASGLKDEADKYGLDSVARAKKDYLSGPRPERLGVVSGRLRSSIASEVREDGQGLEVVVGTNVKYAAMHELGFTGMVNVPAHLRVIKMAFGKPLENTVVATVRPYSRNVDVMPKPFIRPAMQDALYGFEMSIANMLGRLNWGT